MSATNIVKHTDTGTVGAYRPRGAPPAGHWTDKVETGTRGFTVLGLAVSALFLLGFGTWASTVPLAGAAVASGVVSASGRNLQIQHLEGGIIESIEVAEGEHVKAGQPLFMLDSTAAAADRNRLSNQLFALQARAERLAAERDGAETLIFSEGLRRRDVDPTLAKVLDEQLKEFNTKLNGQQKEIAILNQQIAALDEQIEGVLTQKAASEEQLAVVKDELVRRKTLLDKGLANRRDYTDFLLSQAELTGQVGNFGASVLTAKTQIAEKREEVARQESKRVEAAAAELNEVRTQIADIGQQLSAAEAVLGRIVVRSPSDGIVVKLDYNAKGAVVAPGQPMLELLPTTNDMIVEARISPRDIDVVHMNQEADLRFTALNRLTPTVPATVTFVSPDRLTDARTEEPYYVARLRITDELPPSIDPSQIYPGMPVETYIKTGDRTFLEYLIKPLEDSLNRAFREE